MGKNIKLYVGNFIQPCIYFFLLHYTLKSNVLLMTLCSTILAFKGAAVTASSIPGAAQLLYQAQTTLTYRSLVGKEEHRLGRVFVVVSCFTAITSDTVQEIFFKSTIGADVPIDRIVVDIFKNSL